MSLSPAEVAAVLADPTKKVDNLVGLGGSPGFVGTAMGGLFNSGGGLSKSQGFDQDDRDPFSNLGGSFRPGGQASAISAVLGATGATESAVGKAAIDKLQNAMDRKACNESGGFYTMGGACLVGEAAQEQVNKILENPDAPSVLKSRAEAYVERNDENNDGTVSFEEADNIEDVVLSAAVNVINTIDELNAMGNSTADDTTLGDDLQTKSETLEVIDGYDDLTDEQKEAIDNAIVAGANVYMGGLGDLDVVFTGVEAGGSSASDSANAAANAAANAEDADAADASANASADASADASSASAGGANTDQEVDTSVLQGLPDSGAGSSNETGGQKSSDGTPDNEYAVIDADGNPVLNDDGTEKKVVVWEDADGSFVVIGDSTVINTDDGPYVIVNTGDEENEWGTSGVWTATDKDGNTTEYDFDNDTVKDIVITEVPNTDQEGTGDQTATQGSGSATSTGTFPPYVPPVITLPGSSGTGIGGLFNVDLESILGTIIVNSILNSGSDSSNAGNVLSSEVTTPNTTNNTVNNTTVDPNAGRLSFDDFPVNQSTNTTTTNTSTTNTDPNAGRASFDDFPSDSGNGGNGGDGVDGVDGGSDGDGDFPTAGTYAGGYCKTRGADGGTFVARYHDGTGGTYEQERFEAVCSTTGQDTTGVDTKSTGGNGGGDGPGQGPGDGPGDGDGREPEPEPEPIQQMASPSIPSSSFTADGEINYQDPGMVNIIEPAALGLLSGLASNSMDGSADLLGRLSFSSQQAQQSQQGFNQLQGFDQLQGLSNSSMFDNVLRRNYIA